MRHRKRFLKIKTYSKINNRFNIKIDNKFNNKFNT